MPTELDPVWEYWQPDPEILEAMGASVGVDLYSDNTRPLTVTNRPIQFTRLANGRRGEWQGLPRPRYVVTPRSCGRCGKRFTPGKPRQRFCSRICSNNNTNETRASVAEADKRAHMLVELTRAYGTLTRAAREVGMLQSSASRLLIKRGVPVGYNYKSKPGTPMTGLVFTYDQAQRMLLDGAKFGDVYPGVEDPLDRQALKDWFVRHPDLPVVRTKPAPKNGDHTTTAPAFKPGGGYTGNPCEKCSSLAVRRDGACLICDACGDGKGGCG